MAGSRFAEIVEYDVDTWALVYIDDTDPRSVNYATAPKSDPHNWTKAVADNPILTSATPGIRGCAVLKDGITYHVLYDTEGQFCYASGDALNNLTKHSSGDGPVFRGNGTGWEQFVRLPTIIKVGEYYHLFYDGRNGTAKGSNGDIGHARSTDFINWTRSPNNPVLTRGVDAWEAGDIGAPHIALIGGLYYLFYAGYDNSGAPFPHWIGYATATNINGAWKKATTNPVISPGAALAWDEELVSGPAVLFENSNLHVYFDGSTNDNGTLAIGYATRD